VQIDAGPGLLGSSSEEQDQVDGVCTMQYSSTNNLIVIWDMFVDLFFIYCSGLRIPKVPDLNNPFLLPKLWVDADCEPFFGVKVAQFLGCLSLSYEGLLNTIPFPLLINLVAV